MGPSYDTLPLDPYLEGIGAGRFRAYSKFAYVFPGKKASVAAAVARLLKRTREDDAFFTSRDEDFPDDDVLRAGDFSTAGALVEVPDPKFNQPSGYSFEGREDGVKETVADRTFVRLPRSLIRRPEFKEILARFASYARLDPRYASSEDDDPRFTRDSDQSGRRFRTPRASRARRHAPGRLRVHRPAFAAETQRAR
jgi:hypothetical protein